MSNAENVLNDTQIENNNIIPETTGTNAEAGNTESTATAPSETTAEVSAPVVVAEETAAPTASGSDVAPVPAELDEAAKAAAAAKQKKFDEAFEKIKAARDNNTEIEVVVKDRIRGGLRVMFEEIPIFLPASHFSLKRNPSEEELKDVIGITLKVKIHELETDETKGKAVIVSRKQILEDDFWNSIKIGDVVEGPVSSIASFGIFLDLGGVEGLIHISRLSQTHVADTKTFAKKGQMMKASVVELDRAKNRIALSSKDLEESPWKDAETKFVVGTKVKGIVRRLTEFGAYVEVAQGIDGLLRTGELSWTKRIKSPADILKAGEEIEVEVVSVSAEKRTLALSLKRTTPSPWNELKETLTLGKEINGVISQVITQGAIVTIEGDIDGFMPRSKMRNVLRGKKIPYNVGDPIEVVVTDLVPEQESLILAPKIDPNDLPAEGEQQNYERGDRPERGERRERRERRPQEPRVQVPADSGVTFQDMLSEKVRKSLFDQVK